MRVLIDENMGGRRLAARLEAAGHEIVLATDVGLASLTDARVLIQALGDGLPVLTRDLEDFADLHDLILAAGGHHPGILVVRFDNDPRHNLTERAIATSRQRMCPSPIESIFSTSGAEPWADRFTRPPNVHPGVAF